MATDPCVLTSTPAVQDRAPAGRKTRLSITKSGAEASQAAAAASAHSIAALHGEAGGSQPGEAAGALGGGSSARGAAMGTESAEGGEGGAPHLPGQLQPLAARLPASRMSKDLTALCNL